jgi:hypothetical protein
MKTTAGDDEARRESHVYLEAVSSGRSSVGQVLYSEEELGFALRPGGGDPGYARRGGGHILVLDAADPERCDPLREACGAAVRVLLRELGREFRIEGIRGDEVRLANRRVSPERCAEALLRLLVEPPEEGADFSTQVIT